MSHQQFFLTLHEAVTQTAAAGYSVHPVTRTLPMSAVWPRIPSPTCVVVAVRRRDLNNILEAMPECWRDRALLLQNGLLPHVWSGKLQNPTVAVCWYEKDFSDALTITMQTVVAGPNAGLVQQLHEELAISCKVVHTGQLLRELLAKSAFLAGISACSLARPDVKWSALLEQLMSRQGEQYALIKEIVGVLCAASGCDEQLFVIEVLRRVFRAYPNRITPRPETAEREQSLLRKAESHGLEVPLLQALVQEQILQTSAASRAKTRVVSNVGPGGTRFSMGSGARSIEPGTSSLRDF
eukprot:TRINITY_DN6605_c2_g4_i2.p1 TRINITY_DN6605_c2_g4~~TRINITY_DN6605_c2_g4_i2.p1  ORF type:complete len:313 (+),score=59.06 TRINITY_DN6605_c2_g4_i2:52-939(+)